MDQRLRDLRREAEALLQKITAAEVTSPGLLRPIADMQEAEGSYVVEIELPGVRLGEVQVYSQNNCIVVEGLKPSPELPTTRPTTASPLSRLRGTNPSGITPISYQCLEREYGPFRRAFSFPGPCDLSQARASLQGGLLTILVPKLAEDRRSRRRPIPISDVAATPLLPLSDGHGGR